MNKNTACYKWIKYCKNEIIYNKPKNVMKCSTSLHYVHIMIIRINLLQKNTYKHSSTHYKLKY